LILKFINLPHHSFSISKIILEFLNYLIFNLFIFLYSFGKSLNLDVISGLILYILIDLSFIPLFHVFDPRNDLLV